MSVSHLSLPQMFFEITGARMTEQESSELRLFLEHAPTGMAQSPSFMFDLIVRSVQARQLRSAVTKASEKVLDDVEDLSRISAERLMRKVLEEAHASAPSFKLAFWRSTAIVGSLLAVSLAIGAFGTATAFGRGWLRPNWLTSEISAKVRFAEAVETKLGPNPVDWAGRTDPMDPSLLDILYYAERRGTDADPYQLIRNYERCNSGGQTAYRRHGRLMCKYEVITQ